MHAVLGHSLIRLPCLPRLCGRGILECTSISCSRWLRCEPILKPASYRHLVVSEAPRRSQWLLRIIRKTWFSGWWVRTRKEGLVTDFLPPQREFVQLWWHWQSWWLELLPGGPYASSSQTLVRVSWHFAIFVCYIVMIFIFLCYLLYVSTMFCVKYTLLKLKLGRIAPVRAATGLYP